MMDSDARLKSLEIGQATTQEAILAIKDTLKGIGDSLETIATLETHHQYTRESINRAFVEIKRVNERVTKLSERVQALEIQLPGLVEARGWIILAMLSIVASVGGALIYIAMHMPIK